MMKRFSSRLWVGSVLLGLCLAALPAFGADEPSHGEGSEASHGEHAGAHGHGAPHLSDVNWFDGMVSRPEGTPIPVGALLLNTAVLFFLIGYFGGPALKNGLQGRKQRLVSDMEAARAMKVEAEGQLATYEKKLQEMESEMARIRDSLIEQAKLDRDRILKEAEARRVALEAEARSRVSAELALAREEVVAQSVVAAVRSAEELLRAQLTSGDQERLVSGFAAAASAELSGRTIV